MRWLGGPRCWRQGLAASPALPNNRRLYSGMPMDRCIRYSTLEVLGIYGAAGRDSRCTHVPQQTTRRSSPSLATGASSAPSSSCRTVSLPPCHPAIAPACDVLAATASTRVRLATQAACRRLAHARRSACCMAHACILHWGSAGGVPAGARRSEDNRRLLEIESPRLAAEGLWAHATPRPEAGGLLIASLEAADILGDDALWQVRSSRHGTALPLW